MSLFLECWVGRVDETLLRFCQDSCQESWLKTQEWNFSRKGMWGEVGKLWWEEAMHKWQLLFGFPSEEIERIASVRCASDHSFCQWSFFLDALALIKYLSYGASSSWFSGLFLQRKKNKALFFIISINQIETLYPLFKKENHDIKNIFNNCLGEVWQHWFWAIS